MKELLAAVTLVAQMSMSNPTPMTSAEIAKTTAGTQLHFVLRIDKMQRTTAVGHVLDQENGSQYRVTPSVLSVYVANDLPVVMGSHDDLKPGTVVFVYGVATKPHAADATKLVVITPYVKTQ